MKLANLVVRRRGWIGLAWLVAAVVCVPRARRLPDVLQTSARVEGSESAVVEQLLRGPLASAYSRYAVLVVQGVPTPQTSAGAAALHRIVEPLASARPVAGVFSYLDQPDSLLVSLEDSSTFVIVGLVADSASRPDRIIQDLRSITGRLADTLRRDYPAVALRWTGDTPLNVDLRRTSATDVQLAERRALPVTAALLLLAFGAIAAALVPVLAGALAIAIALGAAAVAAGIWPLSILLQSVVPMLGLGLGIDYALLMVSRFRDALASGRDLAHAAEESAEHAGHTILLSAATVALGFLVLLTVPLNEMRAIAAGGLLVVITSALLATTLLPGVLAVLGPRIEWGRVRRRAFRQRSMEAWRRWGRWVTGHPWIALAAGGLPLVLLSTQAARLHPGLPRGDWLPTSMESARALSDLRAMGRSGMIQTVRIVLTLAKGVSVRQPAGWDGVARYTAALERDARVGRVRSIVTVLGAAGISRSKLAASPGFMTRRLTRGLISRDGNLALVEVMPKESVAPDAVLAFVRALRDQGPTPPVVRVTVGGLPAFNADYQDAVAGRFWQIVALVVGGTMLALLLGFRSVLVPVKAVLLNLLSVAAAFGALTLAFQDGHGSRLLGVAEPLGAVFASLPVIVFCIVFGLSMDYEVFLMTRVQEARNSGASDRDAIVEGLSGTGQVITNAAAIMLIVFAAFTLGQVLLTKLLGF
ncbi:MAG TPA: MMPL family transporter, partial [Gemmatimonadales bacterium]|nr:MMPL family transporter [Gemmatimonadales bacterium]